MAMKNKPSHYPYPAETGLSMAETLVATAIVIVITVLVFTFIIEGTRVEDFISDQSAAVTSAQNATTRMTSVLREVTDGDDGGYSIVEATGTSFTLYSDLDADAEVELIQYYLDDTNLIESIIEPAGDPISYDPATAEERVLSSYVVNQSEYTNDIFTYYNSDYPADTANNPLTEPIDPTDVTLLQVRFDVNVNPNRIPDTDTVSTFIQLRNLKTKLHSVSF